MEKREPWVPLAPVYPQPSRYLDDWVHPGPLKDTVYLVPPGEALPLHPKLISKKFFNQMVFIFLE